MKLLYRADGGHPIGTGHLYRASRILRFLAEREPPGRVEAHILTAEDSSVPRILGDVPAAIHFLPPRNAPDAVKPLLRAAPVLDHMDGADYDLVVMDMLDTPEADMAALAATGVPLVTFDDRGEGRRHASAIINILVTEPDPASLPAGVRLFEGGPYVVADPLVVRTARRIEERDLRHARRAFVTMGGADAAGLTVKVACALHLVPELEMVEFASGPAFPHREELEEVLRDAPWESRVLGGMPTLAERYLAADVAVVAGGLTMYEVCLIGTPAVAVAQPIDHQFELAARLQAAGAQLSAGWGLDATVEDIARAVRRLVEDEALRRSMSAAGRALVDGRGTERVCDVLLSAASASRRETA